MVHIKINEVLEQKNKSVYWLAKELKCSYNNLNKLVKGQTDSIKFEMIDKICDILECDLTDIMKYEKGKL